MKISYFISVPSFKSTAFVICILAKGLKGVNLPPPRPPCLNATSEPPCTIGLRLLFMKTPKLLTTVKIVLNYIF